MQHQVLQAIAVHTDIHVLPVHRDTLFVPYVVYLHKSCCLPDAAKAAVLEVTMFPTGRLGSLDKLKLTTYAIGLNLAPACLVRKVRRVNIRISRL